MGSIILKYRWAIILITLATTLIIGYQARYVETETDIKKFLPEEMTSSINMKKIEEIFGGTDMIVILLETDDVLVMPCEAIITRKGTKRLIRLFTSSRVHHD